MQHFARLALGLFGLAAPALADWDNILDLQHSDIIPGKYIVSLKPGTDVRIHLGSISRRDTVGPEKIFGFGAFSGYAGEFDDDTIARIWNDENVVAVEPDRVAYVASITKQADAPWGIASLSSRSRVANDNSLSCTYSYDDSAGAGTYAYVLDSGVLTTNSEFGGRAIKGYNVLADKESFDDHFGHGTHVAGTIASNTYGVAKKATIVDVKVVDGRGYSSVSHVLDGLNWAVNNITSTPGRAAKSVINMSLEFTTSLALNRAVDAATSVGVLSIASAGNDGDLASKRSPGSASTALTVGAVHPNRTRASWSNFGGAVDVFAPGVSVASLWNAEGAESVESGTSMAAPHVAGLALYLKALGPGLDTPAETISRIKELATKDVVGDAGTGSPNLLAYNGIA